MRKDAWKIIKDYRIRKGELKSDDSMKNNGFFILPIPNGAFLKVVVSDQLNWDHISVSLQDRIPTWGEMNFIKKVFFYPHEVAMQLHPAIDEYVNNHPYVLHLWRPQKQRIPLPPIFMV